jgi:hypothetical protein
VQITNQLVVEIVAYQHGPESQRPYILAVGVLPEVLVLPKRSFAVIQGEDVISEVLVKHYFSGSWKTCKDQ